MEDFSGTKVKANVITVKDYWKSFNIIFIDFHLLSVCPIYSLLSLWSCNSDTVPAVTWNYVPTSPWILSYLWTKCSLCFIFI